MGIGLLIDDFGTGQASLSYLKNLPVDSIKIDQSFVRDMLSSHSDCAIVKSSIQLAHDLGMKVIAEGVEQELVAEEKVNNKNTTSIIGVISIRTSSSCRRNRRIIPPSDPQPHAHTTSHPKP